MGKSKALEMELDTLLSYRYSSRQMVKHVYMWYMVNGTGFVDVADIQDTSIRVVSDYLRKHWLSYLYNRLMVLIGK